MLKALTIAPLLMLLIAPGVRAQSLDATRAKLHGNILQLAAVVIRSSQSFDALRDNGCPTSAEFNFTEKNTQQELESMVPSSFAPDFSAVVRREMDIHRAETQNSARGRVNGLVQKGFSKSVACLNQMYTTRAILVTARESFGLTADALQRADESKDLDAASTRLEDGLSHLGGWAVTSAQRFDALRGNGCPASTDANLAEEDIERELESMLPSPSVFASAFRVPSVGWQTLLALWCKGMPVISTMKL